MAVDMLSVGLGGWWVTSEAATAPPAAPGGYGVGISGMLRSLCTIQRRTDVDDNYMTRATTWADVFVNVKCDIQPRSGDELAQYGRVMVDVTHVMYSEPIELREKDRVVSGGTTFEVVVVRDIARRGRLYTTGLREERD